MTDTIDHTGHDTHEAHGDHPTERAYWQVFVLLAVVTAVEIAWSYIGVSGVALVLPLVVMMVFKFYLVVSFFMHLKYDLSLLNGRTFTFIFGSGLALAALVYLAVFASFEFQI
jgi:cytochrome c oxidase subunit 4